MISVMPAAKYQSDFSFSAASRLQAGGWFDKISWFRGALGTEAADNSILSPLTSPDRASQLQIIGFALHVIGNTWIELCNDSKVVCTIRQSLRLLVRNVWIASGTLVSLVKPQGQGCDNKLMYNTWMRTIWDCTDHVCILRSFGGCS